MTKTSDTKQAMRYRTSDAKRRRRYRQISKIPVEDLSGEVHGMRELAEKAYAEGNVALYNALCTTIGKLARDQTALKRMNAEYIERAELRRLVERLCDVVSRALEGRGIPGWESIVDDIANELTGAVEEPREEAHE